MDYRNINPVQQQIENPVSTEPVYVLPAILEHRSSASFTVPAAFDMPRRDSENMVLYHKKFNKNYL